MKNLPKEELLSRLEAINRSNAIIYFDLSGTILGFLYVKIMQDRLNTKSFGTY